MFKKEVRIIAWDDCEFKFNSKSVTVVGVIFRGGQFLDGLLSIKIAKDGLDATEKISSAINSSRHYDQLSLIMLDGITFAGFNMVDIKELRKRTELPVIVVQRDKPNMKEFLKAMKRFDNYSKRKDMVRSAGKIYSYKDVYYQKSGLADSDCEQILDLTCVRSKVPEPIRVAHIIASGLSGESRGGA